MYYRAYVVIRVGTLAENVILWQVGGRMSC